MNRRDLFKFMGVGAAALLVPSATAYFLPPAGGWRQGLRIRRIQQYLICDDTYPIRYDATWDLPNGQSVQFGWDFDPIRAHEMIIEPRETLRHYDDMAKQMLLDRMHYDKGSPNSPHFRLDIPKTLYGSPLDGYIYA